MTITVKAPSAFLRGGLTCLGGSVTNVNTFDEAGVIACLDSAGRLLVHGKIGGGDGLAAADDPSHRELERYDPSTDIWTTLAASIQYQFGHAWIIDPFDRIIYAAGRALVDSTYYYGTDRGEIYDPLADTWTSIPVIPVNGLDFGARFYPYFFKDGFGQLNVISGLHNSTYAPYQDGSDNQGHHLTNGWTYSGGSTGTWTEIADITTSLYPITQRDAGADPPSDGAGVPWRVEAGRGQGTFAELWQWNGLGFTQYASRPAGQERGYGATPAVWASFDGCLYVAGGISAIFTPLPQFTIQDTTWKYDPLLDVWTQLANLPRGVSHASLVEFGGFLYLVGGRGVSPYAPVAFISQYDPIANVWTDTADVLSVARALPSVVRSQDGTGFWVYGGNAANWGTAGGYTNVLEWWVPFAISRNRGRAYGQIVG